MAGVLDEKAKYLDRLTENDKEEAKKVKTFFFKD